MTSHGLLQRLQLVLLMAFVLWPTAVWPASPVVLVLGDSLSAAYGMGLEEGWVALLQDRLVQEGYPHRVVNASVSGDTTRGGLGRLPDALRTHEPTVMILELGGNDGLRGLAPSETARNLKSMIEIAQGAGVEVLLTGMRLPPNYGSAYTSRFEVIYPTLAERHGTALVPFLLEGVAGKQALMQPDGIHPRVEGQPQILDNVWPHLQPLLRSAAKRI